MSERFDVVILGGGLAGLAQARHLRREVPSARVAVIERTRRPLRDAAHKVGESSVELASHFYGQVLGLDAYLRETHLVKNGLRFFPGGGRTHRLEERTEIGPPQMPQVPSYQLDRGRLEHDLRAMIEADGAELMEGTVVRGVTLAEGDADHVVEVSDTRGQGARTLRARWVVDASGWQGLLRKQLGLGRPSGHRANAAWWRLHERVLVDELVPESETAWHARDPDDIRWLSTVHFMGEGYWVWYIPLGTGHTSIGVVVHDDVHSFDAMRTYDRAMRWLAEHEPQAHARIASATPEDFQCVRHYSHATARAFSPARWSLIGPAGAFTDPFYSPGSDFIAIGASFTTELVRRDLRGEDVRARAEAYDQFYLRFFDVACETYRHSAPTYGKPLVLAAKIYFDDFSYWAFSCQYFFQRIFALELDAHEPFLEVARGFAELNMRAQRFFSEWARRADDPPVARSILLPPIPSVLANLHLDLERRMSADETLAYMREKLELTRELLGELVLRAALQLGPDEGAALARSVDLAEWGIGPSPARVAAEATSGGARRRALSSIARDVERCLGRAPRHPSVGDVATLLDAVVGAAAAAAAE